jgi:glyoxylase-like metal-dependent hydrolase (beta-lactamase superfamily II)/rhodanese-related sulfurtransferase
VGSQGKAAVIDPQRDVEHYVRDAKALGFEITTVVLTHTNADFVAGHTELARRVGAKVWISAESGSSFPNEGLKDGTKIPLGAATLEAMATPGHTLDSMTILVHVPGVTPDPVWALTGDTLFVGGIGRPDLVGGDVGPVLLAGKAFESVRRLKALPDGTIVLPAHGAGSLCGAHLSPETTSTIGREKAGNPYLVPQSRTAFIARMVTGLPVAPAYFKHNVRINREGPPVVDATDELPKALAPADVKARVDAGAWVVDLRDAKVYAEAHLPGAVNVAVRGRLDTWTGIVVPFEAEMILVGSDAEVKEAAFRYRRIGLDKVAGRLDGGVAAWAAALQVRHGAPLAEGALRTSPRAPSPCSSTCTGRRAPRSPSTAPRTSPSPTRTPDGPPRQVAPPSSSAQRLPQQHGRRPRRLGFEESAASTAASTPGSPGLPTVGTASPAAPCWSRPRARRRPPPPSSSRWIEPRTLADALLDRAGARRPRRAPGWQFTEGGTSRAASTWPRGGPRARAPLPRGRAWSSSIATGPSRRPSRRRSSRG